jgi:hypothetical protein
MSLWSAAPPRTTLNDAIRGRYSCHDPKTENFPDSKGPAHYTPRHPNLRKSDTGNVILRHVPIGKTERDLTLSNGVNVRHVLPAGPGTYEPVDLWKETRSPTHADDLLTGPERLLATLSGRSTTSGKSPSRSPPLGGAAKLASSALRHTGLDETIGPGSYSPSPPASPSKTVRFSQLRRDANNALPRPQPLSPDEAKLLPPVGTGKPSTADAGLRGSPRRPPGKVMGVRGPTISTTARTFNLHNPNSFTFRHKDVDFAVPPPGWYNARDDVTRKRSPRSGAGTFSTSPRRIDLARRTAAPGPGTYSYENASSTTASLMSM